MAHPLEQKIGEVRRRARALLVTYGLCVVVGTLLVSMMAVGLADYFIHFRDRGVRVICLLVVLGASGWVAYRYLLTALRSQMRDVDVALRIERRFPAFQDRLASTIEFLKQSEDDPQAGSPLLRRTVIAQTTAEAERLKLSDAIDWRPAWRALSVAGGIFLIAVVLSALDFSGARLAVARLFQPFGGPGWPKANHLVFTKAPRRIALGQPFEVELVDDHKARLPDEVRLFFRYEDEVQPPETMHFRNGAMVFRKEQVERPFSYRAEGGDDDSQEWIDLEVVEPPLVERMTVRLHYPEYTGWEPKAADPHLRTLVGTRVEIDAKTTKPIRSATLRIENGLQIPAVVKADGYGFSLPVKSASDKSDKPEFKIEKSGAYTFDLEDLEGFHGAREVRYEIRAIEDRAPTVSLDEPASNIFVTADAVVPLKIVAKDDLAIREIALHHARSDKTAEGETKLVLFQGPPTIERRDALAGGTEIDAGDNRTLEHRWDLAPLGLKPGVQITVHASATDYRPLVGQSHPRRLTIITRQEQEERVAERQTLILGELARVLKLQRESRGHLAGLQIQMEKVGQLSKQDIDHLQGAELTQRQVERGLTSKTEGVPMQIEGLLSDLRNNKVDSPEVERRMTAIKSEIQRLGKDHLPAIDREMTSSLKASQEKLRDATASEKKPPEQNPAAAKNVADSLTTATEHQDEVIKSLEQMLGELSQWDNYRRFHREIGQLRHDQDEIARETSDVGRKTLTKNVKELDPQQQADLEKLANRQVDLGRRFDKIQQRMQQMAGELKETDPLASGTLSDALHEAQKQALGGQMRQAGRNLEQNQIGQAGQLQQQSSKNMQELLDILSNRRERELAGLVKKLREAEQELAGLNKRQEGLRKKMEEAAKNPNEAERREELKRLSREQKQLQEEVERFARRLQRLQAEDASRSAAKGGGKMGQAGQQGEKGDAQGAQEQAKAAKKDLDDAQEQLAQQRKQAEMDLAMEQLARMEDAIKSMIQRQAKVLEETQQYEKLRADQGRWTRPQLTGLQDLSRQQMALQQETGDLEKKLAGVGAFQLVLKGAARDMSRAADLLDQRQAGEPTQRAEANALKRFEQLMSALKTDGQQGDDENGGEGQGGDQQQGGEPTGSLAELKLMKLMQEDLNSRTRALEETLDKTKQFTAEQQEEYAALGQEQGKLADLLLELTKPIGDKMKDDPTRAPLPLDDEGDNSKQGPKAGRRLPVDLNEEPKP
jgi:hypothetical protein